MKYSTERKKLEEYGKAKDSNEYWLGSQFVSSKGAERICRAVRSGDRSHLPVHSAASAVLARQLLSQRCVAGRQTQPNQGHLTLWSKLQYS
jgi:hypothetical protein